MGINFFFIEARDEGSLPNDGWDCAQSFVVAAHDPRKARELAATKSGDEGPSFWLNTQTARCSLICYAEHAGARFRTPRVICRDFKSA